MAILYLTEQGSTVNLTAGRIIVRKGDKLLHELPVFKLEQIVAYGNVHLTPAVIAHCLRSGIEVAFLSSPGKYRGRLQPEFTKNSVVRQQQYKRAADPQFCLKTAATIVAGKVRNMAAMIKQQRRLRGDGRSPLGEVEKTMAKIQSARTIDQLNGHEGAASAAYFKTFRAALKNDWGFEARQYHPPKDPVNGLLSLGYTLLYNDVYGAVNVVGLDPYMGFFHQPRHGHACLASDLMEEHRCVLVDRLVLSALNLQTIKPTDFEAQADGRITLKPEALKRFFGLYAQAINEQTHYPYTGIQTTYRQVIELQVRHFARVLTGEEPIYHPFEAEKAMAEKPGR
ncbi:CRISPR-associated endonuclease Cas1 [candidate division KSB1 bacterium]|nr:CRISPR-associated endonuclease Cas1 [candidate division KSB1 bacterium]